MRVAKFTLVLLCAIAIVGVIFGSLSKYILNNIASEVPVRVDIVEADKEVIIQGQYPIATNLEEFLESVPKPPELEKPESICGLIDCKKDKTIEAGPGHPILRIPPKMPVNATKSGSCSFDLYIGEQGRAMDITKLKCTDSVFEDEVSQTAMQWVFKPKVVQGKLVPFHVKNLKMAFHLVDEHGDKIPE